MHRSVTLHSRARQRGMATILIVLLAGMAITATTVGVMYTVRSTQDQQMSSHASTEAESLAWAGAEMLRLYLTKAEITEINKLPVIDKNAKSFTNLIGGTLAEKIIIKRTKPNDSEKDSLSQNFVFEVTGKTNLATSTLRIVYNVTSGNSGSDNEDNTGGNGNHSNSNPGFDGAMNLYNGLDLSGGLKFEGGNNVVLNIQGATTIRGGVTGINILRSTGDIKLDGGGEQIKQIVSNGSITLDGGASTLLASAIGNITTNSGANQGALNSNGNITITNGSVSTANALGFISASSGGNHGGFTAGNFIQLSNGKLSSADAVGDVKITGWPTLTASRSQASVSCPSINWNNFTSIRASISAIGCPASSNIVAPSSVAITTMAPLQPFSLTRPTVDARPLENSANYAFKFVGGKELITVKNINGLANGDYRLGKIKKSWNENWGYLCKETNSEGYCIPECSPISNGNCTGVGIDALKLFCRGQSPQNKCLSYDTGSKTWSLDGSKSNQVIAPGIAWFEGNLKLGNGLYRSTFLATGTINAASGDVETYATNYAGYTHNCQNSLYGSLYPSNLCREGKFQSTSLGNIALLAGSYNGTVYQGGNISVGSSTKAYGDVIAGNQINGDGGATINGYITAAGLGTPTTNKLTAGLKVILSNLPATYTPGDVPNMGSDGGTGGGGSSGNGNGEGGENTVRRLWVRPI